MNLLIKYYDKDSIGGGIPDEVRRKIEEKYPLTGNSFNDVYMLDMQRDALWGYSLASEKLKEKDEEISRLKEENERLRGEGWLDISKNILPLETQLLIKHKYGIDAVQFHSGKWRYWYSGAEIKKEIIETAKLFLIVDF